MKKLIKLLGISALILVLGFSAVGCFLIEDGDDGNGNGNGNGNDNGTQDKPGDFKGISAVDLVADIKIGWNLGNTFDAHNHSGNYRPTATVVSLETAWVSHRTTQNNIKAIKNAGFNTIRIPVSWHQVADPANNFKIREEWMKRVAEVVDWAVEEDMYVILNTHHDESIFKFTNATVEASLNAFGKIWEQIADHFKNYNEKLIFEALNEPRTKGAPHEWSGIPEEYTNLNKHYKLFLDIVRASGGNNDKRILMLNTYAANSGSNAMNGLKNGMPTDPAGTGRIVVSIHAYEPFAYAHGNLEVSPPPAADWSASVIDQIMNRAETTFVSAGYPVIIGEFGVRQERHDTPRAREWADYYVKAAKQRGIKCVWWDDHGRFRIYTRNTNTFHTEMLKALIDASK